MAATYTAGSTSGKDLVRLLIADTDTANALLSDEELTALLSVFADNHYYAAARALEIIAISETLVLKKISILKGDLSTDGPAVAKALRDAAKVLREEGASQSDSFAIIELNVDPWTHAELVRNQALRSLE